MVDMVGRERVAMLFARGCCCDAGSLRACVCVCGRDGDRVLVDEVWRLAALMSVDVGVAVAAGVGVARVVVVEAHARGRGLALGMAVVYHGCRRLSPSALCLPTGVCAGARTMALLFPVCAFGAGMR